MEEAGEITFGIRQASDGFVVFQSSSCLVPSLYFTYPGYGISSILMSGPVRPDSPGILDCSGSYGRRVSVFAAPPNFTS
jgi:hypothetical protein